MTTDLGELARRIATELAARDQAPPRGGPPTGEGSAATVERPHHSIPADTRNPPGVRFVRDKARIADFIDHTLLKAEATAAEIDQLCAEARDNGFAAVCVNPVWVRRCAQQLGGSAVGVATVIGFPLGANRSEAKRREAELAVADGATELDMVAAVGHAKSGDWRHVADDIAAVVAGAGGRLVKVIIESAALSPVEIVKISALAKEMGAQYVKTSTGFHPAGGASAEAVALMRMVVGDALGVKASGGVRECETALRMVASGATRIGTSSGVSMARCLGAGPLPLNQLLSLSAGHSATCTSCGTSSGGSAY
jgi:deoxyribose-phosphate aldolase